MTPSLRQYFLAACILFMSTTGLGNAAVDTTKIKSVKSLTHMLSKLEKNHGKNASLTTMRLQIYLEDVYISQGTTLFIRHELISNMIASGLQQGLNKAEISKFILRQYKRSELNETF